MVRHILDRQNRHVASSRFSRYETMRRAGLPVGTGPVSRALLRRVKRPINAALRTRAFLRIDRQFSL